MNQDEGPKEGGRHSAPEQPSVKKVKARKSRRPRRFRPGPRSEPPAAPPEVNHAKLAAGAVRIAGQLPQMGPIEVVRIWSNALRLLDSPSPEMRVSARHVVEAVENVWRIRASGAPQGWFPWPTTSAGPGSAGLDTHGWESEGMLRFLGYRVGVNGESLARRRTILRHAFEGVLPPMFPADYMQKWSRPSSAPRLRKIAESLASFTRSAKRRDDERMAQAIAEWQADLEYMRETFYVGRFQFGWPSSVIEALAAGTKGAAPSKLRSRAAPARR